jgi:hypothetical protein
MRPFFFDTFHETICAVAPKRRGHDTRRRDWESPGKSVFLTPSPVGGILTGDFLNIQSKINDIMKKSFVVLQPVSNTFLCHTRASIGGCDVIKARYKDSYTKHVSELDPIEFAAWARYESFGQENPNDLENAHRVCRNLQQLSKQQTAQ